MEKIRQMSYEFLLVIYRETQENSNYIGDFDIGEELGFSDDETETIVCFLRNEDYIDRDMAITGCGIDWIESQMINDPNISPKKDELVKLQEKRMDFLAGIFDASSGHLGKFVDFKLIADSKFLTKQELDQYLTYFKGKHFLRGETSTTVSITLKGIQAVDEYRQANELKDKNISPWQGTIDRIIELCEFREEYLAKRWVLPGKSDALKDMRMDSRTIQKHAPELYNRWDEEDYRPDCKTAFL